MFKTNRKRLQSYLETFSQFGKTSNGGVTRLSLSQEDIAARTYFKEICEASGLTVCSDDMGTMYATLQGQKLLPPITMGSHADTVIKGGRFDGILGVVAALEVAQTIQDNNITLDNPLTIINFTNEEGARFEPSLMASGVLSGQFDKEKMLASTDTKGVTFAQALTNSGFEGRKENRLQQATAYVELHIEQGPVLAHHQQTIGIVEGVLGMVCYDITLLGESNHAGTTPINMRKDSMFATMKIISILQKQLQQLPDDLVYTIGRITALPNVHTVIPNQVTFSLEARHQNPKIIAQVEQIIHDLPTMIDQCELQFAKLWARDTVHFAKPVVEAVTASTKALGLSHRHMYSGAGHDAQFMSHIVPSAMIFVPSTHGYSHREDEYTSYEDCSQGADVLLNTVLNLAGYPQT